MRKALLAGITGLALAGLAAPASAATTVGPSTAIAGNNTFGCAPTPGPVCTFTNLLAGASRFTSPIDGVVTRWRVRGAVVPGNIALRILRSPTSGTFVGVGRSATETVPVNVESVFTTRLPIRAGDGIGIDLGGGTGTPSVEVSAPPPPTAAIGYFGQTSLPENGPPTAPLQTFNNGTHLFNADVEPDADGDEFGDESQDQCPTDGGTQGQCPSPPPPPDQAAPSADVSKTPKKKTESRTAVFKFSSDDPNATFQCRIDRKAFKACTSPRKYRKLKVRKHKFRLIATDSSGNTSPETTFRWRVVD